jgi:TolB-like protein/tetratricopeptide (TPR) repeat protein
LTVTLEPGQSLAHYRIERLLGRGGMGAVYLAEDTKLHRRVALKVLPQEMAASRDRLARFQREAQAVAALNHPHIVTLHSVEEAGGAHFLTMELVEGETLDRTIHRGGMPLATVFDVGIAVADALAAAHDKGIVHRDLKPANIMVAKGGRVKVLDFGLAKLAHHEPEGHPATPDSRLSEVPTRVPGDDLLLTRAGVLLGTVPYMSPEQVNGLAVDARSDVFSLGVVLYEMATGRRPFQGTTQAETISAILRDMPRPVTETRRDAPRHLGRIIDHCLQKEPSDRFQTARDVCNELRALRKEVESGAAAPTRPASDPGAASGASRARLGIGAGAALVIAIAAFIWRGGLPGGKPGAGRQDTTVSGQGAAAAGAAAVTETNSLAVLPFTNTSPEKDQEYFSDGLTEELLNALVKIRDLKVAGRTSSFSFKGKNDDARTIGEKLGVANLLEGSVRKSGNRVRIAVQLVKSADGFQLWSETYDRTLDDIFAVQDDIAKSVARALQVTLLRRSPNSTPSNPEAYDLVLQARYVMRVNTPDAIRRAREMLERALSLAPDDAAAWAEMGLLHIREQERSRTAQEARQAVQRTREALTRALKVDPDLAVAHSRMASVQRDSGDFAAAERSTERALASDPKNPIMLGNASTLYSALGRLSEAIALQEQARHADPLNVVTHASLVSLYVRAGRLVEAEAMARKAVEMGPDSPTAHQKLGNVLLFRGQAEAAREEYAKCNELEGSGDHDRLYFEAIVEHTAGHAEASKRAAEDFEKRFASEDPLYAAEIRAWRGDTDAAFAWLDKALSIRDPLMTQLKAELFLSPLHADARWNALLQRTGLPTD